MNPDLTPCHIDQQFSLFMGVISHHIQLFNLRNGKCLEHFKKVTDKKKLLNDCVREDDDVESVSKRFMKELNKTLHQCFKKIRVTSVSYTHLTLPTKA